MKISSVLLFSAVLAGCGETTATPRQDVSTTPAVAPTATASTPTHDQQPKADNSGVNKRDDHQAQLTPLDQGASDSERSITAGVRKAVMAEKGLSVNGQNVKIITVGTTVTLRGPVASASEQQRIGDLARGYPGVTSVDNQLDVTESR